MNKTETIHARIEPKTKKKAEKVLKRLGMSPTEAIRIFYNQISLCNGIPFPIRIPNSTTQKTLEKSARNEDIQSFDSLDKMFDSWEE